MTTTQPPEGSPRHKSIPRRKLLLAGCLLLIVGVPIACLATTLLPLLPGPESIWHPQWSPNGDYLAFNCLFLSRESLRYYIQYPEDYVYLRGRYGDVCLTDRVGSYIERLSQGGSASYPSWSPDGTILAWRQEATLYTWEVLAATKKSLEVPELSDLSGQPQWSLDGRHLYIDSASIEIATGHITASSTVGSDDLAFGFTRSRDGTALAYYQYRQCILQFPSLIIERGSSQEVILDARQIQFRNISTFQPSPLGTYIGWIGYRQWSEGDTLYLYRVATSDLFSLSLDPRWRVTDVAWSQDEEELALQTPGEVHILSLALPEPFAALGSNSGDTLVDLQYVNDWTISSGLSWGEDADHIAVSLGHDIWVIDLAHQDIEPLLHGQRVSFQQGADEARVRIADE